VVVIEINFIMCAKGQTLISGFLMEKIKQKDVLILFIDTWGAYYVPSFGSIVMD